MTKKLGLMLIVCIGSAQASERNLLTLSNNFDQAVVEQEKASEAFRTLRREKATWAKEIDQFLPAYYIRTAHNMDQINQALTKAVEQTRPHIKFLRCTITRLNAKLNKLVEEMQNEPHPQRRGLLMSKRIETEGVYNRLKAEYLFINPRYKQIKTYLKTQRSQ